MTEATKTTTPVETGAALIERLETASWDTLRDIVRRVLKQHDPMSMYGPADDCPHTDPGDGGDDDEWAEYQDNHPFGVDESGDDGDRICLLSPTGRVLCRECHDEGGELRPWPCPDVQAIHEALGSEQ